MGCSGGRFLQEIVGPSQSAVVTITIVLDKPIESEGLAEAIIESPSFEVVTETVEVVTKGTVSAPEVVLIEITQPPTQAPTALPTEEPTQAPTALPTEEPTHQKSKKSKNAK